MLCKVIYQLNSFIIVLLLISINIVKAEDEKQYIFHYEDLKTINGSGTYFDYDFKISKQDESDSIFIVNANIEQLEEFDDNWKTDITVFRADEKDAEFSQFLKFPRVSACFFMKSIYKNYFYESIKDYSNLPHYDKCPLTKEKYWIKDYPFDASIFKQIAKEGVYRIEAFIINGDEAKAGIHIFGSVEEKK